MRTVFFFHTFNHIYNKIFTDAVFLQSKSPRLSLGFESAIHRLRCEIISSFLIPPLTSSQLFISCSQPDGHRSQKPDPGSVCAFCNRSTSPHFHSLWLPGMLLCVVIVQHLIAPHRVGDGDINCGEELSDAQRLSWLC